MKFNTTDDVLKFKSQRQIINNALDNNLIGLDKLELDSSLDTQKQVNTDVKKKSSGVHL